MMSKGSGEGLMKLMLWLLNEGERMDEGHLGVNITFKILSRHTPNIYHLTNH